MVLEKKNSSFLPSGNNVLNAEILSDFSFKEPTSNTYKLNYDKNNLKGFVDLINSILILLGT